MLIHKKRIYRILSLSELKLHNYILQVDEDEDYNYYLADMEYVATRK